MPCLPRSNPGDRLILGLKSSLPFSSNMDLSLIVDSRGVKTKGGGGGGGQ